MKAMQGRPQLFENSRQISVLVSTDDYEILSGIVEKARVARPGYSFGDLLRGYIHKCLADEDVKPLRKLSPARDRVRRLHAIARSAAKLARELDSKR